MSVEILQLNCHLETSQTLHHHRADPKVSNLISQIIKVVDLNITDLILNQCLRTAMITTMLNQLWLEIPVKEAD
jgi:hypothetical protein